MLPLGLVALNWLRLYLPLVEAGLPQTPRNAGPDGLGFAGDGFRALLAGLVPRLDLRIGARFGGGTARAVHAALQEAADLIARMPATYMTYPNGGPVLPTTRRLARRTPDEIVLDGAFLAGFGTLAVPRELWRALGRFSVWVEPALIAEWLRLMRGYAARQGRILDEGVLGAAMTWSEPARDTALPRDAGDCPVAGGQDAALCVEWTASGDGNPRHRPLPALDGLAVRGPLEPVAGPSSREPAREARPSACRTICFDVQPRRSKSGGNAPTSMAPALFCRADFRTRHAPACLVLADRSAAGTGEVFAALRVQRLRLRHDQQVPEWAGKVGLPQGPERGVARGDPAGSHQLHALGGGGGGLRGAGYGCGAHLGGHRWPQRIVAAPTKTEGDRS